MSVLYSYPEPPHHLALHPSPAAPATRLSTPPTQPSPPSPQSLTPRVAPPSAPLLLLLCRAGKSKKSADKDDDGFATAGKKKGGKAKRADPSLLGFSVESSRIMQGEIQFVEGA